MNVCSIRRGLIRRRDLLQSIISTNHLFAVTCFYVFKMDQIPHEQLPDSSANGPAHSSAQDLSPSAQIASQRSSTEVRRTAVVSTILHNPTRVLSNRLALVLGTHEER
jgi:hypothetical protein